MYQINTLIDTHTKHVDNTSLSIDLKPFKLV